MNIGPTEIILVLAIALLVFGPSRLPQMGRSLGRGLREFKNAANTAKEELGLSEVVDQVNSVKDDITSSLGVDDIKESISGITSPIDDAKKSLTATFDDAKKSVGAEELAAGVGSVKAAMAFNPKTAAKGLLTSKPSSGADKKAGAADGDDTGTREPASPAAVVEESTSPAAAVEESTSPAVVEEPASPTAVAEDAAYLEDDDGFQTVTPSAAVEV